MDHELSEQRKLVRSHLVEDIESPLSQNIKSCSSMMTLQDGIVVIEDGQSGAGVDLE